MLAGACTAALPEQSDALDLSPKRIAPRSALSPSNSSVPILQYPTVSSPDILAPDSPVNQSEQQTIFSDSVGTQPIDTITSPQSSQSIKGSIVAPAISIDPERKISAVDAYRLGAGDRIRVTVFGEEDLSGEFQIDSSGNFSLPLIGQVDALNVTTRELETQISGKLADGFLKSPRTSIEVLNYRPFYILGEVNQPGSYPYQAGLTVLNAAALAGGFTYRADEGDMSISRNGDPSRTVKAQGSSIVLPGDVVRIEERFF